MGDEIRVSESLYMQEGKLRRQAEAEAARLRAERDRYREALRAIAGANPAEVITRELSMAAEAALESTDHAEKRHDPDLEGGEDE